MSDRRPCSELWRGSRRRLSRLSLVIVAALLGACGSKTPEGNAGDLSVASLKLAVLDAIGGPLDYCDPDSYPVTRGTELQNAQARLRTIKADAGAYEAILDHRDITDDSNLTPDQVIAISDDYKQMHAIELAPSGAGFAFSVLVLEGPSAGGPPTLAEGTVDRSGRVAVRHQAPGEHPVCPICLAARVAISTPNGPIDVSDLAVGMPVWTTDRKGHVLRAIVLRTGHMAAPHGHRMVRLVLADGRALDVSPGHPTVDGRNVGDLEPGDRVDGSHVVSVARVAYPAWVSTTDAG